MIEMSIILHYKDIIPFINIFLFRLTCFENAIMESEELDKDLFKNWVRGSKGLEYLQEGLQEFVGEKVLQCRDNTLQKILSALPSGSPQQCNQCTENNLSPEHFNSTKACNRRTCRQKTSNNCFGSRPVGRRKCPDGICSKFYDAIIDEHAFEDPLWKNTDPSTWCSDPHGWSYAKCFQTTKDPGTSAQDTDAAGLLSIIINNKSIQNFVTRINPHTRSSFHTARDIRNKILHSSKLEIDETTVCSYLDAFIVVLQDPKCLINEEASKKAVHKLTQLKNNTIHISQGDTVSLLENRNKALTELDERTAKSLRKLDEKALVVQKEVKNVALAAKRTVSMKKRVAISKINTAEKQAKQKIDDDIFEIEKSVKMAKNSIVREKGSASSAVHTKGLQSREMKGK
ncbi:uncharacterized protein LOC132721623 [Ruditapes philippinarum]|uniref:uncharacterized protein LOC132721623 n=1 Tax=Ruditapes philippinarum TaxID=129788 RepID=UPI00295AF7E1|nr:uncharacterized protein LOC132721623 [Ruditapes philippinarum]